MANRFLQQVVLVTGGAQGIGRAMAEYAMQEGAKVCVLDIQAKSPEESGIDYYQTDVRDAKAVAQAVQVIHKKYQRIDVLVASAGEHLLAPIEKITPQQLQQVFAVNVFGLYYTVQAVLPIMQAGRYGRILLMGSEQAMVGRSAGTAYGMSKAAVVQLAKSLSMECAGQGILVNALCPSTVADTTMTAVAAQYFVELWGVPKQVVLERFAAEQLTGKLVSLKEVTDWMGQLCSAENQSVTGVAMLLDGGLSGVR